MFDQELVCAAAINRIFPGEPGISCALYNLYGSYSRLFSLSFPELESLLGKRKKVAEAISDPKTLMDAEQELARLDSMGYKAFHRQSGDYPGALLECNDSPAIIFIKGGINLNYKNIISVVGTRRSTPYGESSCRRVVRELAMSGNNPVIVSGLAYGIDITAHRAALDNGLQTIAVLPCGPDRIYPSSHSATAERIALFGALLTEFPEGTPSYKLNFIQRNRIIAGVSRATIVIESDIKGGALTTAELAQGYSREVYALPGRFGDRASSGLTC
ncbi:MAG: DNA-processing protein DprA [Bacteroidales bacterium]|nr:DNA-processing protein DprA [Bacteroidales bacterium]